jgi:hypothetical protein
MIKRNQEFKIGDMIRLKDTMNFYMVTNIDGNNLTLNETLIVDKSEVIMEGRRESRQRKIYPVKEHRNRGV